MVVKAMILAVIVALLAACGGGGTEGQGSEPTATSTTTSTNTPISESSAEQDTLSGRLTLEEMRAWCTEFNDRGEEKFSDVSNEEATWGNAKEAIEWIQDELASVNPPEELEEFWGAWQRVMEVALSVVREKPAGELVQDDELTNSSEFMAANRALIAIHTALDEAPDREAYNVALPCSG